MEGASTTNIGNAAGDVVAGNKVIYAGVPAPLRASLPPVAECLRVKVHLRAQERRLVSKMTSSFQPLGFRAGDGSAAELHFLPRLSPARYQASVNGIVDAPATALPSDDLETLSLDEVMERHPVVVLRGDPGAGKTTCCQVRILADCHRHAGDAAAPVPLLVELGRLSLRDGETGILALARLIGEALAATKAVTLSDDEQAVELGMRLIEGATEEDVHPRLAFYFDGLNEIVSPANRRIAARALADLAERVVARGDRMVVTTRRYGFDNIALTVYDIQPLTTEQVAAFIRAKKNWPKEAVDDLLDGSLGRGLTTNPQHLEMLCSILPDRPDAAAEMRLPHNSAELYGRYIDDMLRFTDAGNRWFDQSDRRNALRSIAFHMQTRGVNQKLTRVELESVIDRTELSRAAKSDPNGLIESLCSGGFLVEGNGYVFADHQTLQEYLCAEFLDQSRQGRALILDHRTDPTKPFREAMTSSQWWEAAAYLGGMVGEGDLGPLLSQCPRRQLAAMMLRHATPGSACERRYVDEWFAELRQSLARASRISQMPFVILAVIFFGLSFALLAASSAGLAKEALRWAIIASGLPPLGGLPLGWVLAVAVVFHFLYLGLTDTITLHCVLAHDRRADRTLSRLVTPVLVDLCHLERPEVDVRCATIIKDFIAARQPDDFLRLRLARHAAGAMPRGREELEKALSQPFRATIAASILAGLRDDGGVVERVLAAHGQRDEERQSAERLLLISRLTHLPEDRRAAFLEVLERHIHGSAWPFKARSALAEGLRLAGYAVRRPAGWFRHVFAARLLAIPSGLPDRLARGLLTLMLRLPPRRRRSLSGHLTAFLLRFRIIPSTDFLIRFVDDDYLPPPLEPPIIELLERAMQRRQADTILHRVASWYLFRHGDAARGLVLANLAEDLSPDWHSTISACRALLNLGRLAEAEARLEALSDPDPEAVPWANHLRAVILEAKRRYGELSAFVETLPPEDPFATRPDIYLTLGDMVAAEACLGTRIDQPTTALEIHMRRGHWPEVRRLLAELAERNPDDPKIIYGERTLGYHLGEFDDANGAACTPVFAGDEWPWYDVMACRALARPDPARAEQLIAEMMERKRCRGVTLLPVTAAAADMLRVEARLLSGDAAGALELLQPWLSDDWLGTATVLALCAGASPPDNPHLSPLTIRWSAARGLIFPQDIPPLPAQGLSDLARTAGLILEAHYSEKPAIAEHAQARSAGNTVRVRRLLAAGGIRC